jgi:hypothetical protein
MRGSLASDSPVLWQFNIFHESRCHGELAALRAKPALDTEWRPFRTQGSQGRKEEIE